MIISYKQFAATYGSGSYGGGNYSTGTSTAPAPGGTLSPTGTNIMFGLVGGVLLIVIAVVLFITVRRRRK